MNYQIFKQYHQKKTYGTQVQFNPKNLGRKDDKIINFFSQTYDKNQLKLSVENIIHTTGDQLQKKAIFKNGLRSRIMQTKQKASNFTLQQLSTLFPWVFSCKFIFQPLRSIIACIKLGIQPSQRQNVLKTFEDQTINLIVNQAIFMSLKYQSNYLQLAKNLFLKQTDLNIFKKIFNQASQFTNQVYDFFVNPIKQSIEKIKKISLGTGQKSQKDLQWQNILKQFQNNKTSRFIENNLGNYIKLLFDQVKPYGQILVHFGYLKHSAQKRRIGNRFFYYFWNLPKLLINCENGIVQIYSNENGTLRLINEQSFTLSYLRNLAQAQIIKMSGKMMKYIQQISSGTTQQKQVKNSFYNTFIKNIQIQRTLKGKQTQGQKYTF